MSSPERDKLLAENITHGTILGLDKFLRNLHLKPTTARNYLVFVIVLLNYAKRCGYVQFRIDPFARYKLPQTEVRQSWLTVEQIKAIRDVKLKHPSTRKCRDLFMLSYYLGGININDLLDINFNEQTDTIHYVRKKTEQRPKMNKFVEFEIPDEAKEIINRYKDRNGYIKVSEYQRNQRLQYFFSCISPPFARLPV